MKLSIAILALAAATVAAQNAPRPPIRAAASTFASVEVHINQRPIEGTWYAEDASYAGPARIAITYGQPHARGRKIVGGLIPNDTVWRFGANEATTLHSDVDLTLGSFALPRGDYSLFLMHGGANWTLVVNSQTHEWGTDYDKTKDIGRVPLVASTKADNEESLTIYLVPSADRPATGAAALSGALRIRWGTLELSTPWTVTGTK